MTPERWQQVKTLFHQALERDPPERAAFVADRCVDDPDLQSEVESLLATHEEASDALETPLADLGARLLKEEAAASTRGDPSMAGATPGAGSTAMAGEHVGPYRLLREVGWGGMGTIYEAVRDDDAFRKRVAIKIVRREMASQLVVSRFRHERQILADLDHPNIAALFDGGVTRDGRPYFAMEFVEGKPINEYCSSLHLPVRERVALLMRVCEAVQYAHKNLIVHRDLKPGNILVTASGQPKLLDFGIAKLLAEGQGEAASQLTRAGDLLLTPDYASPEQVRGGPVTTAVDVYALGVILYELLTGRRPYSLEGRPLQEIVRTITEGDPLRPSAAVSEETAGGEGGAVHLRRRLAGDLDCIVLKAIRKEPDQRYASVEQLREDLQRFLEGHPVRARSDSQLYRMRKFVRRHLAGVATVGLLIVVLLGGIVATLSQARRAEAERARAEERFNDLRGLTNSMLFEIHDSVADLPGATPVRSLLVQRGVEYLDRLSKQSADDPSLQREVAAAYLRLGMVQGNPTTANLGDFEGARASSLHALSIGTRLLEKNPDDRDARRTVALAQEKLSDVEAWVGEVPAAVARARQALESWRVLSEGKTDKAASMLPVAVSYVKLGDLLGNPFSPNRGDYSGAMAAYQSALRMLQALPPEEAKTFAVRRYLGILHERIGDMHLLGKRYAEATASFGQSRAIREVLASENETNRNALRDVGISHEKICSVHLAQGDGRAALTECRHALAVYQRLHAADQRDTQALITLAIGHLWVHRALAASGELAAALAELERSTMLFARVREVQADAVSARRRYAHNLLYSGRLQHRMSLEPGVPAPARAALRQRSVADFGKGREMLKIIQTQGAGTAEDETLLRETAAELGLSAEQ